MINKYMHISVKSNDKMVCKGINKIHKQPSFRCGTQLYKLKL